MRIVSPALVVAMLSCTGNDPILRTAPDPAVDASGTPDASAPDAGRVSDASVHDASVDSADSTVPDAGPVPIAPGDVVVLSGETLSVGPTAKVTEWRNAVAPLDLTARPISLSGPTSVPVTLPSGQSAACVAWSDGDTPLSTAPIDAFVIGTSDYSLTAVVQQGPSISDARDNGRVVASIVDPTDLSNLSYSGLALMTEYQDPERVSKALKFAARISYRAGAAVEVVESTLSAQGMHVATVYRRGDELRLRIDGATYGPVSGASNVVVPSNQPLIIGSTRTDLDPDTRFAGRLCALILHRGPETEVQISARVSALRARFLP